MLISSYGVIKGATTLCTCPSRNTEAHSCLSLSQSSNRNMHEDELEELTDSEWSPRLSAHADHTPAVVHNLFRVSFDFAAPAIPFRHVKKL